MKKARQKGFSLIAALIILILVSITVATLGKFFTASLKVGSQLKVYKTTKEAAESISYAVIDKVESDDLSDCEPPPDEQCKPLDPPKDCTDEALDPAIKQALENSGISDYKVYLLSYCNGVYLFEVKVSKGGGYTKIIFAYRK